MPNRTLFKRPAVRGDLHVEAWNEWTLCLWARSLARATSAKTGRVLKAKTIESRISLAKGLLSHRYGFQLAGEAPRLKAMLKQARMRDPLGNTRKKRRGFRRKHIRDVWQCSAQVRSPDRVSLSEFAAVGTAWHVLARGGELGGIRMRDVHFSSSKAGKRAHVIVWIRPLKKKRGVHQPHLPQFIAQQEPSEDWHPYEALRRLADARQSEGAGRDDSLFLSRGGKPMTTACFRALVKRYAKILGFKPSEFGAHSPRIGGASELMAHPGSCSELLLQAKGRWDSQIGRIYTRMTRRAHLAASDCMFQAAGRDLEEILPEFVEPA